MDSWEKGIVLSCINSVLNCYEFVNFIVPFMFYVVLTCNISYFHFFSEARFGSSFV